VELAWTLLGHFCPSKPRKALTAATGQRRGLQSAQVRPLLFEHRIAQGARPITIQIPYGQTILPQGIKLPLVSHDASTARVQYMGKVYTLPITSTDLVDHKSGLK